jgi:hypothetical protein
VPRLRQGRNAVSTFIPVARIADMLLNPGAGYDYNGQRLTYPDIRLVYWCGGNPFHHPGRRPSWCTNRTGPRRLGTPTSCCRPQSPSNATTSGRPAPTPT